MTVEAGSDGSVLLEGLARAATDAPHAAALYLPDGPGGRGTAGWRAVTNGQLWRRVQAVGAGLGRLGLHPGARAVLLVPPSEDLFVAAFGMLAAGVVPVLVDPGIGTGHLRACLREADTTAVIGTPKAHLAGALLGWTPGVTLRVVADAPATTSALRTLSRRTATRAPAVDGPRRPGVVVRALDDVARIGADGRPAGPAEGAAAVLFTSGSTGPPKGVVYDHENFAGQVTALRDLYDLGPGDVQVATFPPFALFGPALGMPTVIPRMDPTRPAAADPVDIVEAVSAFAASVMFASPALLDTLSAWAPARAVQLPGLRLVMSAGAPVSRRIVEATAAMLTEDARLVTPYGATEALPVASVDHTELLATPAVGPPYGVCVGRPAPGVRVGVLPLDTQEIDTVDDDDLLPADALGEILVSGPQVTSAYFRRPEATAAAKCRWDGATAHRMGDVGWLDGDGRLWFGGRRSHLVHTVSGPVAPVPIEVVANAHPGVARSAAVGLGPHGRQRIGVVIEPASDRGASPSGPATSGPATSGLATEVLALLRRHPHTADVVDVRVHPGFPVDIRHNAKIDYGALTQWWEAQ